MTNEFSPEEKLLHLIKGKQNHVIPVQPKAEEPKVEVVSREKENSGHSSDSGTAQGDKPRQGNSASSIVNRPNPGENAHEATQALKSIFNINYLILGLFIVVVLLSGYFVFNALIGKGDQEVENLKLLIKSFSDSEEAEGFKSEKPLPAEEEVNNKAGSKNETPGTSFEDYQKLLDKKTIFAPPIKNDIKQKDTAALGLRDLVKDLSLVGIMPGDYPQVIIEDKKNAQTLFLREGEMIDTMRVKEIQSGRVVLENDDETITLSL